MVFSGDKDPNSYSPLVLAYMGDAVYDLYVRARLVAEGNMPVNTLHRLSTGYVKARAQFESFHLIEGALSDEELRVYKRGRNAKSATVPKNAELTHYRHATGFEALLGYLYIKGEQERLSYILDMAFSAIHDKQYLDTGGRDV